MGNIYDDKQLILFTKTGYKINPIVSNIVKYYSYEGVFDFEASLTR